MVRKVKQAFPNQQLRLARQQRGWTQQQVADHIGAPLALNGGCYPDRTSTTRIWRGIRLVNKIP